jgi:hypothetical protein
MKITVRRWGRDMGEKEIANHPLSTLEMSKDGRVRRDDPAVIIKSFYVDVAWHQTLKLTGDYRMEVRFSESDVIRLFKVMFGSELTTRLIEEQGFTISPELKKAFCRRLGFRM